MIKELFLLSNLSYRNISKHHSAIKLDKAKYTSVIKDSFQHSPKSQEFEIISYNQGIITGYVDNKINDNRFSKLWTEYRAYGYEGYDNTFPDNYICLDTKGERRLKPHLYIYVVEVKPQFLRQGAYKNVIKNLIEVSKQEGCEGRIVLDSMPMLGEYEGKIPNPAIAHWKCGFRFANTEKNKIMEKVINCEISPVDALEGTMYYKEI